MNFARPQPGGNQCVLFQRERTRERGYFIIQRIKKNKENKENQSVCVLCDRKNHTDEFLFYRCMCRWCECKEETICKQCAMNTDIFIHFCTCFSGEHRFYNLKTVVWSEENYKLCQSCE